MKRIISLMGHAGSGKDTAGKFITETYGFERLAYADKLKELALRVNPWICLFQSPANSPCTIRLADYVSLVSWEEAKKAADVRIFLQDLGNESRQVLGREVWIQAAFNSVRLCDDIVITDVRYPNELHAAQTRSANHFGIWISREGHGPVNDHVSENNISKWADVAVVNPFPDLKLFQERLKEVIELWLD